MKPFLKEITEILYSKYKDELDEIVIIFPNKRAKLYFNKYLSEIIDKPIFSPEILTINELIDKFTNLKISDELTLTFHLFRIFKKHIKSSENFDDFYYWGQMLIKDFNDIDNNIVDAKNIFTHISELKEIDNIFYYLDEKQRKAIESFWRSFKKDKESTQQKDFLDIWKKLSDIYIDFNKYLENKNTAYQGMIYKDAYKNFNINYYNDKLKYEKVIFVGFNALNKTERELFSFLKNEEKAEFYWDYDQYYINNNIHEANYFLKNNLKNYYTKNNINYDNIKHNKNIEIISTPSNIGQAKLIGKFIDEFKQNKDFDINKTAIVLADESLLIPVLNSIPQYVDNVNITMGFPISETPAYTLFNNLIELQQTKKTNGYFYHKTVKKIIEHPYIKSIYINDAKELIAKIIKFNSIYIKNDFLEKNDLYKLIFSELKETDNISKYINDIIFFITGTLTETDKDNYKIVSEHLQSIFLTIQKFDDILKTSDIEIKIDTYLSILKTIIKSKTIPFTGEPLQGLQIMGILETRTLDFENLIFLSLNEGILPKTSSSTSYIPYNIRKGFGLPTIEHQDAVYGYYFYRLLHRSKNIKLVYNSSITTSNKEKSRFITQLILENFADYKLKDLNFDVNISTKKDIVIEKNEDIQEKLSKYFNPQNKLSPSAINTYLNCSLMFYFRYIASIPEPQEITEDIDPMQFGSIFHLAMETLYTDFKNNKTLIQKEELINILNSNETIENAVLKGFSEIIFNLKEEIIPLDKLHGKNILIYNVIKDYVIKLLKQDLKKVPFQIIDLEGKYYLPIEISVNGETKSINTGGSIDRVDLKEGMYQILDYKTGNADGIFTDIEELFDTNVKKRPKEVLQTFIYTIAFMYKNEINNAVPGIIRVLKIFDKNYSSYIFIKEGKKKYPLENLNDYKNEFINTLSNEISNIFDSSIPFTQTEDEKTCEYCTYKNICHR
jgi:CRISPR/Cas system-associated exonuclease Cas4 (RecB family)